MQWIARRGRSMTLPGLAGAHVDHGRLICTNAVVVLVGISGSQKGYHLEEVALSILSSATTMLPARVSYTSPNAALRTYRSNPTARPGRLPTFVYPML